MWYLMVFHGFFPLFFQPEMALPRGALQRGQGHHVLDELIKLSDGDPSNLELSGISDDTNRS